MSPRRPRLLRAMAQWARPAPRSLQRAHLAASQGRLDELVLLLSAPQPGLRRVAARGLGWAERPSLLDALDARLSIERQDTVYAAILAARVRSGADITDARRRWHNRWHRALPTPTGDRHPTSVPGLGGDVGERLLSLELGEDADGVPTSRELALGSDDWAVRATAVPTAPHRGGLSGAPTRDDLVFAGLRGLSLDIKTARRGLTRHAAAPGEGFAQRRAAATALGRIGLVSLVPTLESAMHRERLEFEGRPGAGLGVQFPVRNALVWALGECGGPRAARRLAEHLGHEQGATGGLFLPAMDGLWKLGDEGRPELLALAHRSDETGQRARCLLELDD